MWIHGDCKRQRRINRIPNGGNSRKYVLVNCCGKCTAVLRLYTYGHVSALAYLLPIESRERILEPLLC